MTENEAKSCIQGKLDCMNKCDVFDCKNTDECDSCFFCYSQGNFGEQKKAFEMAIQALEEIQQYRDLGTVEHIRLTFELCKGLDAMAKMYEAIGTIEELRALKEFKKTITEIVNSQLIAGKKNYKEIYDCFQKIAKVVQDNY